ncbi:hypothetical protein K440DRAFT_104599 [Wilcoxina mikolae CBS 423.85]|nr:hypothetical protein K440DRAFT_104599 [Wilcoxina mikolae CBS 423.85]
MFRYKQSGQLAILFSTIEPRPINIAKLTPPLFPDPSIQYKRPAFSYKHEMHIHARYSSVVSTMSADVSPSPPSPCAAMIGYIRIHPPFSPDDISRVNPRPSPLSLPLSKTSCTTSPNPSHFTYQALVMLLGRRWDPTFSIPCQCFDGSTNPEFIFSDLVGNFRS